MAGSTQNLTDIENGLAAGERHLARRDAFLRGVIHRNDESLKKK
jgi:hypothetical protein